MTMQELEITIDKNGRVLVAVRGIQGGGCLALTKSLENAIGTVEERNHTAEFYQKPVEGREYQYQSER